MNTNWGAIWTKAAMECRLNTECEFKDAPQSDCSVVIFCMGMRLGHKPLFSLTFIQDIYSTGYTQCFTLQHMNAHLHKHRHLS